MIYKIGKSCWSTYFYIGATLKQVDFLDDKMDEDFHSSFMILYFIVQFNFRNSKFGFNMMLLWVFKVH